MERLEARRREREQLEGRPIKLGFLGSEMPPGTQFPGGAEPAHPPPQSAQPGAGQTRGIAQIAEARLKAGLPGPPVPKIEDPRGSMYSPAREFAARAERMGVPPMEAGRRAQRHLEAPTPEDIMSFVPGMAAGIMEAASSLQRDLGFGPIPEEEPTMLERGAVALTPPRQPPGSLEERASRTKEAIFNVGRTVGGFAVAPVSIPIESLALLYKIPGRPLSDTVKDAAEMLAGFLPPIGAGMEVAKVLRDKKMTPARKRNAIEQFVATQGPALLGATAGLGPSFVHGVKGAMSRLRDVRVGAPAAEPQLKALGAAALPRAGATEAVKAPPVTPEPEVAPQAKPEARPQAPPPAVLTKEQRAEARRYVKSLRSREKILYAKAYLTHLAGKSEAPEAPRGLYAPGGAAVRARLDQIVGRLGVSPEAHVPRGEFAPEIPPSPISPALRTTERPAPKKLPLKSSLAEGREDKIITPARNYKVRYELVDKSAIVPSHRWDTFEKEPSYPEGIQERPYHSDRSEQAKVARQAEKFEPRFVLATTPDAINGAPILASDSNAAIGGNSRAMTIQRVMADPGSPQAKAYFDLLRKQAESVGIEPGKVDQLLAEGRRPVLVRRLVDVPASNTRKAAEAARHFNVPLTQALGQEAAAVSRARTLTPAALEEIDAAISRGGGDATLREAVRNQAAQRDILAVLRREGVLSDAEVNRYVAPSTGALNEEGILFIEKTLAGTVIDDPDVLAALPRAALSKLVRAIPAVSQARLSGPEWDLSPRLKEAARLVVEADRAQMAVRDYMKQGGLFAGGEEAPARDPSVVRLATALQEKTPSEWATRMRTFAADAARAPRAQGALSFYEPPKPEEALAKVAEAPTTLMPDAEAYRRLMPGEDDKLFKIMRDKGYLPPEAEAPKPQPIPERVSEALPTVRPQEKQLGLPWEKYDQVPGEKIVPGQPRKTDTRYYRTLLKEVGTLPLRGARIESAHDVAFIFDSMKSRPVEAGYALYVKDGKPIAAEMISLGTFGNAIVHHRGITDTAIMLEADAIYFAHNHPSGDPKASIDDVNLNESMGIQAELARVKWGGMVIIDGPDHFGYIPGGSKEWQLQRLRKGAPKGKVPIVEKAGERPAGWEGYKDLQPVDFAASFLNEMKDPAEQNSMFFLMSKRGDVRATAIFQGDSIHVVQEPGSRNALRKLAAAAQSGEVLVVTNASYRDMDAQGIAIMHNFGLAEAGLELKDVIHGMKKRLDGSSEFTNLTNTLSYPATVGAPQVRGRGELRFAEPETAPVPATPDLIEKSEGSHEVYGINPKTRDIKSPMRSEVVKGIVDKALDVPPLPPDTQPTLTILSGGWGSGKSTTRKAFETPHDVVADADYFKTRLPEWTPEIQRGNGGIAPWLHEESSVISKIVADKALEQGKNLVYDISGSNLQKIREIASKTKDKGYMVRYLYVHADPEQGYARSLERAKKTGRHTDKKIALYRNHKESAQAFFRMIENPDVDEWMLFDARGKDIAKLAAGKPAGGKVEVVNPETLKSVHQKTMISLEGLDEAPAGLQAGEGAGREALRSAEGVRGLPSGPLSISEAPADLKAAERVAARRRPPSSEGIVKNRPLRRFLLTGEDEWKQARFRDQEEQRLYDIGRASLRAKDGVANRKERQIVSRADGLGLLEDAERVFREVRSRTAGQGTQAPLPGAGKLVVPSAPAGAPMGGAEELEKARTVLAKGREVRPQAEAITAGGPKFIRRARAELLGEFTPLRAAEVQIHRAAKQTVPGFGLDKKFELVAGAAGKAEADLNRFSRNVLKPVGSDAKHLEEYLLLRRIQARLEVDPEGKRVADWTPERARAGLEALKKEMGPARYAQIERVGEKSYQAEMDRALRLQVQSGRMTEELYNRIKAENPFYAPFAVLRHLEEYDGVGGSGRNVSTTQDLTKAIRGIEDPEFGLASLIDRSAEQIAKSRVLAEKNMKMLDLAELAAVDKQGVIFKKVPTSARPRQGYELAKYFDAGKEAALEVHPEIARALKGLNRGESELLARVSTAGATALRAGATTFNVGFQMVNMPFADQPELALLSKYGIRNPVDAMRYPFDWLYALTSSARGNYGKPDALYTRFLESGAANSTISRVLRPSAFGVPRWAKKRAFASTVLDSIAKITNVLEETTKVQGFLRGERIEGLSQLKGEARRRKLEEIASEIRNYAGSPDFARKGEMRQLNLLFMFFNARMQGAARDLAVMLGQKGGARMAAAYARLTLAVGLPAAATWVLNRAPENKDDYDERDEWERENYFLIPMYDAEGKPRYVVNDEGERVRDYRRIPKREVLKLYANTIEAGLDYMRDKDKQSVVRLGEQIFENLSPVSIQGESTTERMESVVSSLNPILRAPIEFGTGRQTFAHRATVPESLQRVAPEEQFYTGITPEAFVWMGKKLGTSPMKLQQLVYGLTGGGISQFVPQEPVQGRSRLSTAPGLHRFYGTPRLSHRELYDAFKESEAARATVRKMQAEGREDEARQYLKDHMAEISSYSTLKGLTDYLGKMKKTSRTMKARESGIEKPPIEEPIEPGIPLTQGIREAMRQLEERKRAYGESP